jgi:hypothetical protein
MLLLSIEIALTVLFLYLRFRNYQFKKHQINPNNDAKDNHNLIKSGRTKRLEKERERFINGVVKILAVGAVVICGTLFWHFSQKVKQHEKDDRIQIKKRTAMIDKPAINFVNNI